MSKSLEQPLNNQVEDAQTPVPERIIHRGSLLHFLEDPSIHSDDSDAYEYFDDGALVVADGHVEATGSAEEVIAKLPASTPVINHKNALIAPGFVDCHVHYPQYHVIAAFGTQLLDWLTIHTFPEEEKFKDIAYARDIATRFLDELLCNGTTTALVFGTVHPQSVDAFFTAANHRNLRMICGKVMMDRNAPPGLLDTVADSIADSEALIQRWHGRDRLGYALTPRFAPTSSEAQLRGAAQLLQKYPGVMLHTHLAENRNECDWVDELYPENRSYLDVYDQFGLLGPTSVFAHSIFLDDIDRQRLAQTDSSIAHCPTSNLFIGSGLFDMQAASAAGIKIGLATDVGGGDSYSLLRTINESYKIQQLQDYILDPFQSFYMATLGGAKAISLDKYIGNFSVGKEADFNILDLHATQLVGARIARCKTLKEKLFVLQMLGDDRAIRQTWVMGKPVS